MSEIKLTTYTNEDKINKQVYTNSLRNTIRETTSQLPQPTFNTPWLI